MLWIALHLPTNPGAPSPSEATAGVADVAATATGAGSAARGAADRVTQGERPGAGHGVGHDAGRGEEHGAEHGEALDATTDVVDDALRRAAAEAARVRLACWAGRFTPRVSLAADALCFEVAPSLRLFGGLEALLAEVRADLAAMALAMPPALAPTPLAARWLARAGALALAAPGDLLCADAAATRAALARLPLAALALPSALARRLTGFGLRRLGEVLALPRAGLGRRLGQPFVLDLARTLGEVPDPQPWFTFPEAFAAALELPAPVEAAPLLAHAAQRLLTPLGGWLAARNAAVRELEWTIEHGHGEETPLPLAFSRPVHESGRIARVLRERLAALRLPAPALGLRLAARRAETRDDASAALFEGAAPGRSAGHGAGRGKNGGSSQADGADGEALAELMDRLVARLGVEAVRGIAPRADYRPENASRQFVLAEATKVGAGGTARLRGDRAGGAGGMGRGAATGMLGGGTGGTSGTSGTSAPAAGDAGSAAAVAASATTPAAARRPLWLLERAEALAEVRGRPWRRGPLHLLGGPERIESGWWDGAPVRRDYFVAVDGEGRWLWLYRDPRPPGGWFLHGWFA